MQTKDKAIIFELKSCLTAQLHSQIKRVIVYGSRARGEEHPESDLDIAILVDTKSAEIEKNLEDIAYKIMWDNDFNPIISLKVFSEKSFINAVQKGFSFYQNVNREGLTV